MLVNETKTEMMVLHRFEKSTLEVQIGDNIIKTKDNMNILGINFSQNLKWDTHVIKNINNCQRTLHGLKVIRKYFDTKKFQQITTSLLFSKLFYAFEIWSYNILSHESKRILDSFYYKTCRVIIKDFNCEMSRENINVQVKRATPNEFSNFCLARSIIIGFNCNASPIQEICKENSYLINRKPGQLFFYDSSRVRIEKNSIKNRITDVFKAINFPWSNVKYDLVRPKLKKIFFKYAI